MHASPFFMPSSATKVALSRSCALVSLLLCVPRPAVAQPPEADAPAVAARAVRAEPAPELDGRDTDAVWRLAPSLGAFRVFDPTEGGEPRFRTDVRMAYDARNLYVLVRAYDARPDSIVALLSRRDVRTPSDQIKVMIDSYHDRRTGYEFAVNPAGVKRDFYTYDDSEEDVTWDAVWDVATRIDSLGWVAEFRIPLSQLRFSARAEHTFGVMVVREVARTNERSSWPLLRRSRPGIASQFAEVTGFADFAPVRRLEVVPYAVSRNVSTARPDDAFGRAQRQSVGADLKYGIASNVTLDATVNPDFGQVEADPAVLNLSVLRGAAPLLRGGRGDLPPRRRRPAALLLAPRGTRAAAPRARGRPHAHDPRQHHHPRRGEAHRPARARRVVRCAGRGDSARGRGPHGRGARRRLRGVPRAAGLPRR
jgi:hypothetical protein